MNTSELKEKPIWQMTGEEFLRLYQTAEQQNSAKKYVYGIQCISQLFGCSIPTAHRIKKSGKIDEAITQIGRKIVVDADLALELAGRKSCVRVESFRFKNSLLDKRKRLLKRVKHHSATLTITPFRLGGEKIVELAINP